MNRKAVVLIPLVLAGLIFAVVSLYKKGADSHALIPVLTTTAVTAISKKEISSFTDSRDNNVYQIVSIGNQVWMAENLKYLPSVVDPRSGSDSNTAPYYYVYGYAGSVVADAKATANYQTYGVLYNWAAAMAGLPSRELIPSGVQGVCPSGWHLPSNGEWEELIDYLGGEEIAGGKLKEAGTAHWSSPNTGATNEVGFTALAGGYRDTDKTFKDIADVGYWWSTTEHYKFDYLAWYPYVSFDLNKVSEISSSKESGFSIRCVRD
ncbi:MAG: FISUMP domain-containing protein [Pseudomonas sp.]|nr:FISUMP domain-containing protein [Pseudomonas sp.]